MKKIKLIEDNYKKEIDSPIKKEYLKIKKDYEDVLDKKPLENKDEIKIYINKKIEELKYY